MKKKSELFVGEILDDDTFFHICDISKMTHISQQCIVEMVEYGLLEPKGENVENWQFSGSTLGRIKTVVRLQRDLDVNLPGAAVIVEMLEELQQLRRKIQTK